MSKILLFSLSAFLLLLQTSCAITASGMGVEVRWVIGDASIACDWETGYPSGANCLVGGAISVEAASVLGGGTEEEEEEEETEDAIPSM